MKVIKADHDRRVELAGVPEPARRPVDIDVFKTEFTRLRSFRLYRFDAGSVIDGHAEEDEVFVVVTSGTIELKIGWKESEIHAAGGFTLSAPGEPGGNSFVAYLPPGSVYRLTPQTEADVAYARARSLDGRSPAVFLPNAPVHGSQVTPLFEERTHAHRLRLKLVRIDAREKSVSVSLLDPADAGCEVLVHVQGSPTECVGQLSSGGGEPLSLQSWDTVMLHPGEHSDLHVAQGALLTVMTVLAA